MFPHDPPRARARRAPAAAPSACARARCCSPLHRGCADFSSEASTFTVQPSLTARAALPDDTTPPDTPTSPSPSPTDRSPSGSPPPSGSEQPADPCAPTDAAVIATCLSAPWGLAPLPDGASALVGERTTGRILQVAKDTEPVLVAQIEDIDASGDGGLLGIALSPSYGEDGLIYAYVTRQTDNRIIRIARGDVPEGDLHRHPQGRDAQRRPDRLRRRPVACTSAPATPGTRRWPSDPASLAGKVLRLDEFGKPAESNPTAGSAIYASGFTQVAGMCPTGNGTVAALDQRPAAGSAATADRRARTTPPSRDGDALWTWTAADGGAADCSIRTACWPARRWTSSSSPGSRWAPATPSPARRRCCVDNRYGRLLTVVADTQGLLWLTTSNKDGLGTPVPSDDRVVVVPSGSSGGEGGPD